MRAACLYLNRGTRLQKPICHLHHAAYIKNLANKYILHHDLSQSHFLIYLFTFASSFPRKQHVRDSIVAGAWQKGEERAAHSAGRPAGFPFDLQRQRTDLPLTSVFSTIMWPRVVMACVVGRVGGKLWSSSSSSSPFRQSNETLLLPSRDDGASDVMEKKWKKRKKQC